MGPVGQNQSNDVMFGQVRQVATPNDGRAKRTEGEVCYPRLPCFNLLLTIPAANLAPLNHLHLKSGYSDFFFSSLF